MGYSRPWPGNLCGPGASFLGIEPSDTSLMNPHWQDHLRAQSVVIDNGRVTSFGHPAAEMQALRSGTVLCDLSHLGLIRVCGEDAASFLQGQLTCDVREINPKAARYGGYCSPKGRLLATFLLWQSAGGFHMQLPQVLGEAIRKRLTMFVLRALVRLEDAGDDPVRMGISGPAAEGALAQCLGAVPREPLGLAERDGVVLIRLGAQRFQLSAPPGRAPQLWDALARHATPGGTGCWDWLDVRAGIATVVPATQDQFVPQMANLDLVGGVSFGKGCYPGQEIVARTHYLGKLKRRAYLAHLAGDVPPAAGDELFSPDTEGQASGMVAGAAPSPEGGWDLLAVVQMSSAEGGELRWKSAAGPRLELLPLPYDPR